MAKDIWNTPIKEAPQEDREYPILPAGTYDFEVVDVQGSEYKAKPGGKIEDCIQLNVKMRCEGERDVYVFDHLFTAPNMAWKISAFARAIGIYKEGMTPKYVIDNAVGEIGKCDLEIHEYNEKKSNRVKKYIERAAEKPAKKPAAVPSDDLPF